MAYKFIAMLALAAVASAQYAEYNHGHNVHNVHAPVYKHAAPVHKIHHHEEEAPAKYDFDYSVHDTQTGDIKQQHEVRDGDNVHGSYSLVDADGLHRIVEYTADEHNGFQATVRREPITKPLEPIHHKAVAHHAASVPVHKFVAAPVQHHYQPQPQGHYAPAPHAHYEPAPVHYEQVPVAPHNYHY